MLRLAIALFLTQIGFHAFIASLPLALLDAGRPDALIGAMMGAAAIVQIPAAFVAGGLIDRFGGRAVFLASAVSFLLAAGLLATGLAAPGGSLEIMVAVRLLQGVGLAACMPAALSLVPEMVRPARLATALSLASLAGNVSLAITPPASLAVLAAGSIQLVATAVLAAVSAGFAIGWTLHRPGRADPKGREPGAGIGRDLPTPPPRGGRTFRPAWRGNWALILLTMVLYIVHWGVITGYLPQRAVGSGADVGFFFTADAVSLMVLRMPLAWLTERVRADVLVVAGLALTILALLVLVPLPTTASLVLAGLGTGGGAAFILPPITVELSRRSDETDRGSAFALYSVAFAVGIAIGSIGLSPFIDLIGFQAALGFGIAALTVAIGAMVADRRTMSAPPPVTA